MKLKFKTQAYQSAAVQAVVDCFKGQPPATAESISYRIDPGKAKKGVEDLFADSGFRNADLALTDLQLLDNIQQVQRDQNLPVSDSLVRTKVARINLDVEMETGTGKTYCYIKTIFELNKQYGFTKFVIVVPSIAIKEGVYKTLQITQEHFRNLYTGVPFDFFLYDSSKLGQVRNFATSQHIQVMVITVGAINKQNVNNLYKDSEKTGGEKPIDLIKATRPIVIVDEPQSVDGGLSGAGKAALDAMNPLCTLRYSATHANKHHMVYRLDAVDAYDRKLVKQIEVAAATIEDAFNKPYVRLLEVSNKKGISAKVELHVQTATGAKPQVLAVNDGDDLQQLAKRAVYADFRVGEINTAKGEEFMELRYPGGEVYLALGQAHGEVDALAVQREMIRRTIKEHLEKEKLLRPKGIKVLSLFFIESVARYRQYDKDGNPVKGDYARIFEEEYRRAAKLPAFQSLFGEVDLAQEAAAVHDGYFSIDKKGRWADPELDKEGGLKNETSRADAERGYNLIMKEKEKLLSFDTPLKFIFSHSALKEGWDNPNVFQICALREMGSERERRQTLGRGLRLCVNQDGQRVYGHDVNRLTVIATESYQEFADQLQKEIEADTGIRFGIVEQHQFATIAITTPDGKVAPLGVDQSKALWDHLRAAGHIDAKGKVQDSLKTALKDGKLALPEAFEPYRGQVAELLRKVTGRVEVKNRDDRETVPLRKGADGKAVTLSEDFKALWDRIKHKTTYRVQFDNDKLIRDCTAALTRDLHIARARLQWRKAEIGIGKAGVEAREKEGAYTVTLDEADIELPDLLTDLQDRTQLTRRTLVKILTECERLDDFKRNPQQFIETVADAINRCKRAVLVDGIRYQRLGDEAYYAQELFETEELTGYLKNMLLDAERSVYQHVIYDSDTERDFADQLSKNESIKVYAKLPGWFKVPTPLGSYNPDWAVLVATPDGDRLYFVVETKSSLFVSDLRNAESAKIECGRAHFKALSVGEKPVIYDKFKDVAGLLERAQSAG